MSIGSHHSAKAKTIEWLTPPHIIKSLGIFDLDPCSPLIRPWDTAYKHYTIKDDGLKKPWRGRVWCNPPYGNETEKWLTRCAEHGNAIALIYARTETKMFFQSVWGKASALLFLKGRLHFHFPDGSRCKANSGGPSVLIAYGSASAESLKSSGIPGAYIGPGSYITPPTDEQRK